MMTIKYENNQDSKLASAILYEYFKNQTTVNTESADSVPPEDLIYHNLGEVIMFIGINLNEQWMGVFKALIDRGAQICLINNLGQNAYKDKMDELKVEYHMSQDHSISYNTCMKIDLSFLHAGIVNWIPDMVQFLEPNNENHTNFELGFNMRDINPSSFFYDMIPKNDYSIFKPGKFEKQRMGGFAKHCISDGEAISQYKAWLAKQPNTDKATRYTLTEDSKTLKVIAINNQSGSLVYGVQYGEEYDLIYNYFFNGDKWVYSFISSKDVDVTRYGEFIADERKAFTSGSWIVILSNTMPLDIKNGSTVAIKNYGKHKYTIK